MHQLKTDSNNDKAISVILLSSCVTINALIHDIQMFYCFVRYNIYFALALIVTSIGFTGILVSLLRQTRTSETEILQDQLTCCCILTVFCVVMLWIRASLEIGQITLLLLFGTGCIGLSLWIHFKACNSGMKLIYAALISVAVFCATMRIDAINVDWSETGYWYRFIFYFLPRFYVIYIPTSTIFFPDSPGYQNRENRKRDKRKLDKLTKAAEHGNRNAQYYLAQLYLFDDENEGKNAEKAVKYFVMAAENGSIQAEADLGAGYYYGSFGEKNIQESIKWYNRASSHGHAEAQYSLGTLYLKGEGITKNQAEAVRLFQLSAEQNCPEGQRALSHCYRYGYGVEQDMRKAFEWMLKSADNNLPVAQFNIWKCYYNGLGVIKDKTKAYEYLLKAYNSGNVEACYTLARYYFDGETVVQDEEKALTLFKKSAENGNKYAEYYLGRCLHEGRGIKIDNSEAMKWLEAAAEELPISQAYIGMLYYDDAEKEQDYEKVFYWMKKAAENRRPDGALYLAECYEKGHGTERNLDEALKWYSAAEARGEEKAHEGILRVSKLMRSE